MEVLYRHAAENDGTVVGGIRERGIIVFGSSISESRSVKGQRSTFLCGGYVDEAAAGSSRWHALSSLRDLP